jgi:tripartite-type tricarboxylate transporter receptor subunit TctC
MALAAGIAPVADAWQGQASSPWTGKTIKLIVGASPGGSTDTIARVVGQEIAPLLGATVIIENRAGAGGNIAADAVAKSSPDGLTLLLSYSSHTINAGLFPKLPYDTVKDFTPISMVATAPALLVVNPSLPVKTTAELIAYCKAHAGTVTFGLGGIGSSLHMATEQFKMLAGVDIVNVPYKGTAPAVTDLLGDHVHAMFSSIGNVVPHVKSGALRLLATTGSKRMKDLPDTPTVAETVKGFESIAWWGVFGPAGMPKAMQTALNAAVVRAIRSPDAQSKFAVDSLDTVGGTPDELQSFVVADVERWKRVVKATGATPE